LPLLNTAYLTHKKTGWRSSQCKTLQGGASLMLVRHMAELLCNFSHSGGLKSSLFITF